MPLKPSDGIRSKIQRARQNIEEFQLRMRAFLDTDPKPAIIGWRDDAQRGQRIYYIASIDEVPQPLADVAADAIHNLRKPLDYIATRIEYAACGTKPKHHVYFPIGRSAAHYETMRRAYIKCAGKSAVDAFDATEPYKGGKGEALWQLHELNKPDKHEYPLAIAAGFRGIDIMPIMRDGLRDGAAKVGLDLSGMAGMSMMLRPADRMCPLKVGDEIFGEPLDSEMHEQRKFALDISFHQPGVIDCEPALPALQNFAQLVDDIVTAFEPLL